MKNIIGGIFSVLLLALLVVPGTADAQTTSNAELQAKLQSILAQAAALQAKLAQPTAPQTTTAVVESTQPETLSGEASISRFIVKDGNNTDLEEGDKQKEVMEVVFRVSDGDVRLNRFDLGFRADLANDERDPWDTFSTVSVWNGSKKLAEVNATQKKNWKEDSPVFGHYTIRLSGLDHVIKESRETKLLVKVDVQKSVKGTADGELWHLYVPNNGIRGLDADKAVVYAGNSADAVSVNLDKSGKRDELIIRRTDSDPNASILELNENRTTGNKVVFAFDIDTDDSKNDIEIRKLPIRLHFSSSTMNTFVKDVKLKIGSKQYKKKTLTDGAVGTATFDFRKRELVLKPAERVTAIVEVEFKALKQQFEGTTVFGSVVASTITARSSDTLSGNQLSSSATGEKHTLVTQGAAASASTMSAVVTSQSGPANDYVTFSGTMTVTAFGQDVYIPNDGTAIAYKLTDSFGNDLGTQGSAIINSTAKETGNYFVVREGKPEKLTLDVTYIPGVTNTTIRMQILGLNFSDQAQAPTQYWTAEPAANYRTPYRTVVN